MEGRTVVSPAAALRPSAEWKKASFVVRDLGLRPRLVYVGPLALGSCAGRALGSCADGALGSWRTERWGLARTGFAGFGLQRVG